MSTPDSAGALICASLRPNWNGLPMSDLQEAVFLLANPLCLLLVGMTLYTMYKLDVMWSFICAALWGIVVMNLLNADAYSLGQQAAMELGCIGNTNLFIGVSGALGGMCVAYVSITRLSKRLAPQ